jgi:hypothetical protein
MKRTCLINAKKDEKGIAGQARNDRPFRMEKIYLLLITCFLISCTQQHYSPEIEDVLQQAGNNRKQLENVLDHYSQSSDDSLKLRAAEFLIINMPGKYSAAYDSPLENIVTAFVRWQKVTDKHSVMKAYGLKELIVKDDVKYITAEYLINNIELAFQVWQQQPWGKNVPFAVFCEEILPYRIDEEPLENWREKILAAFSDLNRTFQEQPGITSVEACSMVNSQLPRFRLTNDLPVMNYSMLMTVQRGTCSEMTALTLFVMRALGIPVTRDITLHWPNSDVGHEWNSVYDGAGKHISFMGAEFNPGRSHIGIYKAKSKVFRPMFSKQQNTIIQNKNNVPVEFQNSYLQDVSHEYDGSVDVEIPIRYPTVDSTGYVYLATMGSGSLQPNPQTQDLPENIYELFCWKDSAWHPVETQETKKQWLRFTIPSNALFYLKNNTTGKLTNVFTVQDGTIQWM